MGPVGASLWSYVVEDETDVESAFRELRRRARAGSGHYDDACGTGTHSILDMRRVVKGPRPPASCGEVAFTTGDDGVVHVAEAFVADLMREDGCIFQMSNDELLAFVGTLTPTADDVRAVVNAPSSRLGFLQRGTGRYAVLFRDARPSGFWFVGLSGD
jgi:hypothetical protein